MGGSSRDVVAKPSAQKGKSQELTTDLNHSSRFIVLLLIQSN